MPTERKSKKLEPVSTSGLRGIITRRDLGSYAIIATLHMVIMGIARMIKNVFRATYEQVGE
jgi:hypothetical protein